MRRPSPQALQPEALVFGKLVIHSAEVEEAAQADRTNREAKAEAARYKKLAAVLTPMAKYYASEVANRNAYDAIQVHGGSGFTRDYEVERLARDARIMNIYEGTSQIHLLNIAKNLYRQMG